MDQDVVEQELGHSRSFFNYATRQPLVFEPSNIIYVNMPQEDIMGVAVVHRFIPKREKKWTDKLKKWWEKIWKR